MPSSEIDAGAVDTSLADFLFTYRQRENASRHTISAYERDIRVLLAAHPAPSLAGLTAHDVRRLLMQGHANGLSPATLARRLTAWRQFFAYLLGIKRVAGNPCDAVHAPKKAQRLPEVLTPDAAVQLVSGDDDSWQAQRDHAIFEVLYSCGLRVSELTQLDLDDIRLAEGELHVRFGKRGRGRVVPLGFPACQALQNWLEIRDAVKVSTDPSHLYALFISRLGGRLTPRSVQKNIKIAAIKQGISQNVYPHLLRHSCASHVLQSSGDLRAVQELLGHQSLTSTQVYTHLDFQHLAQVYDEAHPRAKIQPE